MGSLPYEGNLNELVAVMNTDLAARAAEWPSSEVHAAGMDRAGRVLTTELSELPLAGQHPLRIRDPVLEAIKRSA